jgi:SAM-dependent methyltransferase
MMELDCRCMPLPWAWCDTLTQQTDVMNVLNYLLEQTAVYSLWQAPFATAKLAPLLAHNNLSRARRVLDVGCGPGTNTSLLDHAEYLGVDINPKYIAHARRKYQHPFVVADVSLYEDLPASAYDFILVNSFLHHLDTPENMKILQRLQAWLSSDGYIHLLELVLPGDRSVARFLARADRGKFVRPIGEWRSIFETHLEIAVFEPYPMRVMGTTLWNMVYCKARAKR